jgi:hypothetical protein
MSVTARNAQIIVDLPCGIAHRRFHFDVTYSISGQHAPATFTSEAEYPELEVDTVRLVELDEEPATPKQVLGFDLHWLQGADERRKPFIQACWDDANERFAPADRD